MKKGFAEIICLLYWSTTCLAQELPRRVFLGIRMENLTPDTKRIMELDTMRGVLVTEVFPNSTALTAGLQRGDILLTINGAPVNSTQDILTQLAKQQGDSLFKYAIVRHRKVVTGQTTFKPYPRETYADLDVIYTQSSSPIGQQRIILTKPKHKQRLPVVAFIGGIGCYSLDFPLDSTRAEVQLLNQIARAGYLTARLEKPGQGDNATHCKPCDEVSFLEETRGYVAAIEALKIRDDVDSNAVFVFGHSMGGVFAPLVAQQVALKALLPTER